MFPEIICKPATACNCKTRDNGEVPPKLALRKLKTNARRLAVESFWLLHAIEILLLLSSYRHYRVLTNLSNLDAITCLPSGQSGISNCPTEAE